MRGTAMNDNQKKILDRFTRYISVWTTSKDDMENIPSTERQFDLSNMLGKELEKMGLQDVKVTDHSYVYATLPATNGMQDKKITGFISHVDTATEFSGENVKPIIHENYDGADILLTGSGKMLTTKAFSDLLTLKGKTLITTDGTTLLGADDKAGITAIMTMLDYLTNHPEEEHGELRICFTPDEEVGRGPDMFDVDGFGADYAYTVDGDYEGDVAYENFNACSAEIEIEGVNVHPGEAKDIMVNACLLAMEINEALPKGEIPACTEGREGFYHLCEMSGNESHASLYYILRDHDNDSFENRKKVITEICNKIGAKYPTGKVTCKITDSYANMSIVIEEHMDVVNLAKEAVSYLGMEPVSKPVRGGTDGAQLSFMGLPCPNLGTAGYGFHGPFEHVTVEGMETVSKILVYIAEHPLN